MILKLSPADSALNERVEAKYEKDEKENEFDKTYSFEDFSDEDVETIRQFTGVCNFKEINFPNVTPNLSIEVFLFESEIQDQTIQFQRPESVDDIFWLKVTTLMSDIISGSVRK